jgi:hypothetical protein
MTMSGSPSMIIGGKGIRFAQPAFRIGDGLNAGSAGGAQPPAGYVFLLDADRQYALDADGVFLMERL